MPDLKTLRSDWRQRNGSAHCPHGAPTNPENIQSNYCLAIIYKFPTTRLSHHSPVRLHSLACKSGVGCRGLVFYSRPESKRVQTNAPAPSLQASSAPMIVHQIQSLDSRPSAREPAQPAAAASASAQHQHRAQPPKLKSINPIARRTVIKLHPRESKINHPIISICDSMIGDESGCRCVIERSRGGRETPEN